MAEKSYPIIKVSAATLGILKFIAGCGTPPTPAEIATEFDIKYPKAMTHIATLEREGFIERHGEGYIVGFLLAKFWSKRQAHNERRRKEVETEQNELKIKD